MDGGGDYEKGMTERDNINSARGLLATPDRKVDELAGNDNNNNNNNNNTLGVKLSDPTQAKTDHLELR